MRLAHLALAALHTDKNDTMFKKYFPAEHKAKVQAVFESIVGSSDNDLAGNDKLTNVGWDLVDPKGWCGDPAHPKAGDIMMYLIPAKPLSPTDQSEPSKIIVYCGTWTLKFPDLQEIKCEDACTKAMKGCYGEYRMANIGEFTLHELVSVVCLVRTPQP
jgi:hypothetical protein